MLVLQCGRHDSIIITAPDGTLIEIALCRVKGKRAAIGITAPLEYIVDRATVHHRKQQEINEGPPGSVDPSETGTSDQ